MGRVAIRLDLVVTLSLSFLALDPQKHGDNPGVVPALSPKKVEDPKCQKFMKDLLREKDRKGTSWIRRVHIQVYNKNFHEARCTWQVSVWSQDWLSSLGFTEVGKAARTLGMPQEKSCCTTCLIAHALRLKIASIYIYIHV